MQSLKRLWFTLVELIVALSISALVLVIIFYFVTDTVIQLSETDKNSRFLGDFSRFTGRINSHASTFPNVDILIDQTDAVGHDVLLFTNPESTSWIIWWVLDADTYRLLENADYGTYRNAVMWYRLVSESELTSILSSPTTVYTYDFFGDKTFNDFKIQYFQSHYYNSNNIMSIDLSIATAFDLDLVWENWDVLPKDNLFEVNLNF